MARSPRTSVRALGKEQRPGEGHRSTLGENPRREIRRKEPLVDEAARFGDHGYTVVPKGFKPSKPAEKKPTRVVEPPAQLDYYRVYWDLIYEVW